MGDVADAVGDVDDPADALTAGMRRMLDEVRRHPAQAEWFTPAMVGTSAAFAGTDPVVAQAAGTWVHPILDRAAAAGTLRPGTDCADVAEWVNRLGVSLLSIPPPRPRTPDEEDAALRWFLLPAVFTG